MWQPYWSKSTRPAESEGGGGKECGWSVCVCVCSLSLETIKHHPPHPTLSAMTTPSPLPSQHTQTPPPPHPLHPSVSTYPATPRRAAPHERGVSGLLLCRYRDSIKVPRLPPSLPWSGSPFLSGPPFSGLEQSQSEWQQSTLFKHPISRFADNGALRSHLAILATDIRLQITVTLCLDNNNPIRFKSMRL